MPTTTWRVNDPGPKNWPDLQGQTWVALQAHSWKSLSGSGWGSTQTAASVSSGRVGGIGPSWSGWPWSAFTLYTWPQVSALNMTWAKANSGYTVTV